MTRGYGYPSSSNPLAFGRSWARVAANSAIAIITSLAHAYARTADVRAISRIDTKRDTDT